MAVSTSFKQQCPTCDAMVSVKESMIGKKVECTKCKDKFVAEKPDEDADAKPAGKKDTKTAAKKKTTSAVAGKTPPPGKRPKLEVDDDEDADEEDDEPAQVKNGKAKAGANSKPKKTDEEDDSDEEDEAGAPKKKDKKKLTIGLALAGVGVVILVVAAIFVLRGGGRNNPSLSKGPGGPNAQNPDQDNKGMFKVDEKKPVEVAAVPLTEAERVKLSNLLPGDTEDFFRAHFKELFDANNPLRAAVFETPGALDDADLKKRLGFSLLAIDDMLCADKITFPSWRFTVLHFKDVIKESDLKAALKLKTVGKGIDGQVYYKMAEAHPWFDQLARFSFGVPSHLRSLEPAGDKPTFFRVHNPQTLIIADEAPMLAFLKVKGQFPLLSTPTGGPNNTPAPPAGGAPMPKVSGGAGLFTPQPEFSRFSLASDQAQPPQPGGGGGLKSINIGDEFKGTIWEGTEDAGSKIRLVISKDFTAKLDSAKRKLTGATVSVVGINGAANPPEVDFKADGDAGIYSLKLEQPTKLVGMCKSPDGSWAVTLQKTGAVDPNPIPNPKDPNAKDPNPGTGPAAEAYMTIKPSLKAILDRMEARGADGKDKVLLSSATDMDANVLDIKSPDFKNSVPRKARQFWDVTLLLQETKPRISFLGTALVQRDTLKYRLHNEITCREEIFAREVATQLNERVAKSVARFIQLLVGHEVRLVTGMAAPAMPPPNPTPQPLPPGAGPEKKPDEKRTPEPLTSQITVTQQFTTVDFVLDLLLDNSALTQVRSIAAGKASALTSDMMAAAAASLRHQLAAAGKMAGDRGLSNRQIQVPPGRLPPGAFPRLETTPPSLRIEREPKNRISFMAGLLPYMGHQNLLEKIKFEQSWRDPGNWMAGSTIVPQFLDPSYPDRSRQVGFGDLPVDFAATHYVGIAGVGLDAAAYKRGDPATAHKRGAFSYDESASLDEIQQGRGVANTILMIQVPHDGVTGVSPWIAGGGATLRGVPEKNSIAPFVAANHDKKRGTYAMMADGSVRFIDQNISDGVFKAMCTIAGPAPADFDVQKEPNAPLIPPPADKNAKEPEKKAVDKTPPKRDPEKAPPSSKENSDDKATLQGEWLPKSVELDSKALSAEMLKGILYTFQGEKMLVRGPDGMIDESTYVVDAAKTPRQIVVTKAVPTMRTLGIYELTKGELRLCFRHFTRSEEGFPLAFATQPGSDMVLIVLTRKK